MIAKWFVLSVVLLQISLSEPPSATGKEAVECGFASIYSTVSEETASGEDTRAENLTAAHRSLPFGTLVQVSNRTNGRSVVVRITDRGPFINGRVIDLSQIAARALGFSNPTEVCLDAQTISDASPPSER